MLLQVDFMEIVDQFEAKLSTHPELPTRPKRRQGKAKRAPKLLFLSSTWRQALLSNPSLYDDMGVHLRTVDIYTNYVLQPMFDTLN